jgi:hypothetical protein
MKTIQIPLILKHVYAISGVQGNNDATVTIDDHGITVVAARGRIKWFTPINQQMNFSRSAEYANITSVVIAAGRLAGGREILTVDYGSQRTTVSRDYGGSAISHSSSSNWFSFSNDYSCGYSLEEIAEFIRNKASEKMIGSAQEPAQPVSSVADELKKLKELKDEGVLTEEEFQDQKAKLLAK